MAHIFISYARADRPIVEKAGQRVLEERGPCGVVGSAISAAGRLLPKTSRRSLKKRMRLSWRGRPRLERIRLGEGRGRVYGRDKGILIPDSAWMIAETPLGFRQYQTLEFGKVARRRRTDRTINAALVERHCRSQRRRAADQRQSHAPPITLRRADCKTDQTRFWAAAGLGARRLQSFERVYLLRMRGLPAPAETERVDGAGALTKCDSGARHCAVDCRSCRSPICRRKAIRSILLTVCRKNC